MIHSIACEVFFVNVDCVVLSDHVLQTITQPLDCADIVLIFLCLFNETQCLLDFCWIHILGPPTLDMDYSLTQKLEPFCVNVMLREFWNALNCHVGGVALNIFTAPHMFGGRAAEAGREEGTGQCYVGVKLKYVARR